MVLTVSLEHGDFLSQCHHPWSSVRIIIAVFSYHSPMCKFYEFFCADCSAKDIIAVYFKTVHV